MQGKITIETSEISKLKTACDFADVVLEDVQKFGSKTKAQVKYRTTDQIFTVGRIMDSVVPPSNPVLATESKVKPESK